MKKMTLNTIDYFDKVIGYENEKMELTRTIDIMVNPDKYRKLGVTTSKGLLLCGEPGIGKTTIAKCFIKACGRTAFTIRKDLPDGDFVKHIKETFDKARNQTPSIVFLDDMDKFANEDSYHVNTEEFVTIQSCIDDCKDEEVFVIATANDVDNLPDSLLRVGRFDQRMDLVAPTGEDANKIIKYYLSKKKCSQDIDANEIAGLLNGRSCAFLETIVNEAGIYAGYENRKEIATKDLIRAYMRHEYRCSIENNAKESKYAKQIAYHEAGHAVVGEYLEKGSVNFISANACDSSTKGFVGFRSDDEYFNDIKFMENRVISLLAGKAATEIVYGTIDTGANSDIHRAFDIVERFVDNYCGYGFTTFEGVCRRDPLHMEETRNSIIAFEMERYYQLAKRILIENKHFLDKIADELMDKKVLMSNDIKQIWESL